MGGSGGLARTKSFFQKTLEAARGAFCRGLGRGGDGSVRRRCGVTPRPEDPHPRMASRAGSNPLPQHEGERGGPFLRRGGGGWLDGVGRKARGHSANVGRRGPSGSRASGERRAEQDGEQAQDGWDQAQETSERQEQERGGGHWGGVARFTRLVYTGWEHVASGWWAGG